jgi:nonribosomal peptide synthetase MxcG
MSHNDKTPSPFSPEFPTIFLTGATGFIGAHLLASILKPKTEIPVAERGTRFEIAGFGLNHPKASVICLVLGDSVAEAHQKLATHLESRQLSVDWSRIHIVLGDLSQPQFGMDNIHYENLKKSIDLIIHAAADVSLFREYEQLKPVNVDGLDRVLELARGARPIPVTHLSSYSVFNEASYREKHIVFEEPLSETDPIFRSGYAKSKWIAERLCHEAQATGAPVKILRLPYILGALSTGICNPKGYIDLILNAMLLTSSAPELDFSLTGLPVDLCADLVVRIALQSQANPCIFHLTPMAPIPWSEICETASNYVHNLEHLPSLEWYQHIKKCASTHRELFPVVAFLAKDPSLMQFQSNIYRLRFDTTHLTPYLAEAPAFPPNRSTYLRRYMESIATI